MTFLRFVGPGRDDQSGVEPGIFTAALTERVGYVVYEDEHQLVAEPYADTLR